MNITKFEFDLLQNRSQDGSENVENEQNLAIDDIWRNTKMSTFGKNENAIDKCVYPWKMLNSHFIIYLPGFP